MNLVVRAVAHSIIVAAVSDRLAHRLLRRTRCTNIKQKESAVKAETVYNRGAPCRGMVKSASVQRIFGEDKRGREALNGLRIEQSMSDVGDQEILDRKSVV